MQFKITRNRALHEGGTKFYQQVRIDQPDMDRSLLIQHWGAYKGSYDLAGGQRKILKVDCYDAGREYREKWNAKSNRGYKVIDIKEDVAVGVDTLGTVLENMGASIEQIAGVKDYFDKGWSGRAAVSYAVSDIPETEGWGSW